MEAHRIRSGFAADRRLCICPGRTHKHGGSKSRTTTVARQWASCRWVSERAFPLEGWAWVVVSGLAVQRLLEAD